MQFVTISTAGEDGARVLAQLRDAALKLPDQTFIEGQRLRISRTANGSFVMLEWACTEDDDVSSGEVVRRAIRKTASRHRTELMQRLVENGPISEASLNERLAISRRSRSSVG